MEKTRKLSVQTMIIIALSVLLAISIIVGGTLAYFSATDNATGTLTLGQAITVDVLNGSASASETFEITSGTVIPSQKITPQVKVKVGESTTKSVLRVKLDVTVSGKDDEDGTIKNAFIGDAKTLLNANNWKQPEETGDIFYYVDGETQTNVKIVDSTTEQTIEMLSGGNLTVPKAWTSEQVAGAKVSIKVTVEAVQIAYDDSTGAQMTTVAQYETVFNTAFPGA